MATTHSYDSDQRLVDIPFRRTGTCHLNARMPDNPNLVPPGYYMLFAVNQRGVPSIAKWIHVHAPKKPAAPPLKRGDIVVGTGNRLVRVDASTGATSIISEGGDIQNALGIAFDSHPHIVVVTDSGKVMHVVPSSGAQSVIINNGWLYQDAAVRADGKYAVVNLPSATQSGLFLVDHDTASITKFNTGTHFGDGPTGVVVGKDGHFYVSHLGTPMVIRVDKNTGAETVIAKNGHLHSPSSIAVSKDGHLLVADFGGDTVIHIDPANGHQHIVSSGGHLKSPFDIAVEPSGQILVADLSGDKLIRIDPKTGTQSILAQGGLLAGIRCVEVFGG